MFELFLVYISVNFSYDIEGFFGLYAKIKFILTSKL